VVLRLWTSFDSEFSERDNVLIIGHVLDLSKQEVRQRLDEISRFSELKAFSGEPVKTDHPTDVHAPWVLGRYPSYPHILLLDKILAVGDETF
jgi:ABC-type polysaccharide/polyol phosphate transport system ATPase subunit